MFLFIYASKTYKSTSTQKKVLKFFPVVKDLRTFINQPHALPKLRHCSLFTFTLTFPYFFFCVFVLHGVAWQFAMDVLQFYIYIRLLWICYVHLCDIHLPCKHLALSCFFSLWKLLEKRCLIVENKQWTFLWKSVSGFFYTILYSNEWVNQQTNERYNDAKSPIKRVCNPFVAQTIF